MLFGIMQDMHLTNTKNRFAGDDYQPMRDDLRLTGQLLRIWRVVCDGSWRSLNWISEKTGDPHASISAQLRHLRKERFGAHTVEKKHMGAGFYLYRVTPNKTEFIR